MANLPYLDPDEAPTWQRELHWEPWIALDGGEGGLSFIQRLIHEAASVLKPDGRLILEIGAGQEGPIRCFAQDQHLEVERVVPDLAGLDRVVVLKGNLRGDS